MAASIAHRGPDSAGEWVDEVHGVALGHRRLAVVDLSAAGEQPMFSASGRYVIGFNGEIYNHLSVRRTLAREGRTTHWRGHSDTETLLAAVEAWGLHAALQQVVGMFALALWDRKKKQLILARDRLGEKPLYYGWQGQGDESSFLFGSELKALSRHPAFDAEINRDALSLYVRFNYVPAPRSIYAGIHKLLPGACLTLSAGEREPRVTRYWSGTEVVAAAAADPVALSPREACDALYERLVGAVGQQMVADVPLGAFLSGGVDSSLIVALMQAQASRPVKSFSIGFHEPAYNEAEHAKAVARYLGTDHTELYVRAHEAMTVIPELPSVYDEPFADASQLPTLLVSQLARHEVTVALSGDGGDELFAGYNRHRAGGVWGRLSKLPRALRRGAAFLLSSISQSTWNRLASVAEPLLPTSARLSLPGEKLHKAAGVLGSASLWDLYKGLVSTWPEPSELVIGGAEPPTNIVKATAELNHLSNAEQLMALDMLTYLPEDILVKVDRAAMHVSLETRAPFLDHRLVEFAWRLPLEYKLREGQTKWVLRQLLYRHVPRDLIERPKMGFGIPIGDWLRGPLKEWAEDLLDEKMLRREGYFRPEPVRREWEAHQSGKVNRQDQLWVILMFQSWLQHQKGCG